MTKTLAIRYLDLVKDWTKKAQNSSCKYDESNIYYECAKQLHDLNFQLIEDVHD